MRVVVVVGARPQFIKAAPVIKALVEAGHDVVQIHTGQHYDFEMSEVFFRDLDIPAPAHNLSVGSGSHGWQTGKMMVALEPVLQQSDADWTLVFGDTNSTLAAALVASKLRVPLAHVEAGLRSFNREMPEEHNRRLTDHCSDLLFCPTETAVRNLAAEGIQEGVYQVGDTMYDAVLLFGERASDRSSALADLHIEKAGYLLATLHRPSNVDDPDRLRVLLSALEALEQPVVFPIHPRTRATLDSSAALRLPTNVIPSDPVGYLDMLALERAARLILTDSGGVQKEACFVGVPCVTLRAETEWVETVEAGWNTLGGASVESIVAAAARMLTARPARRPGYGDGDAAVKIVRQLEASAGSV